MKVIELTSFPLWDRSIQDSNPRTDTWLAYLTYVVFKQKEYGTQFDESSKTESGGFLVFQC